MKPAPGSDVPIQSTAFWSVQSTLRVHCSGNGGETDGHTQGYKNPPVPRQLVGESQVPPSLSPGRPGETVSRPRLAGEFRKVRTGAKADLQFYCINTSYPMDTSFCIKSDRTGVMVNLPPIKYSPPGGGFSRKYYPRGYIF